MPKPTIAITIGRAHYKRIFSDAAWHALDSFADVIHHPGDEPADKAALIGCPRDRFRACFCLRARPL